jgi:hypothetical protein
VLAQDARARAAAQALVQGLARQRG